MVNSVTRGHGFLENLLAKKRARLADGLISDRLRNGRILDIGCGFFHYFLSAVRFKEKVGLDKNFSSMLGEGLSLIKRDLEKESSLPFPSNYFNAVTLLASLEHLEKNTAGKILREVYRILSPEGILITTTPHGKADFLLRLASRLKLVSSEEIKEHKQFYSEPTIRRQLLSAGFKNEDIKTGSFEFGLNLFSVAKK